MPLRPSARALPSPSCARRPISRATSVFAAATLAAVALTLGGCGPSDPDPDAGAASMDARVAEDSGPVGVDTIAPAPDSGPMTVDAGADGATGALDAGAGDDAGAVQDAGAGDDAGSVEDAGALDDGGSMGADAAPPDAAPPDAGPPDAGPPDAGPRPLATACDPVYGLECDGDWDGRCAPGCTNNDCCAPRRGVFECVPRDEDGLCPAADIFVDTAQIDDAYRFEWRTFPAANCALMEGCVDAPGTRRLLRFDSWTPNTGTADLYLGPPADNPDLFEFSSCHNHNHFNSYARYELRAMDGTVVARGHKQAFCLLDFYAYPGTDRTGAVYTCSNQGIQMGFQDVYGSGLDCQWVDVTGVPPGDYILRIELNFEGVLLESDYTNNVGETVITIPTNDVTLPCAAGTPNGADRTCGLVQAPSVACTPGQRVEIACSAACGLGSCEGDPFLRVCGPWSGVECAGPAVLAQNDDSGCSPGRCGRGGDCCPSVTVTCPAAAELVPFYGAYDPDDTPVCSVVAAPL